MFASMLEAADYCMVMAYPDEATSPSAGIILLVPRVAEGRKVNANWDTLGMRATRSDALILEECLVTTTQSSFNPTTSDLFGTIT
jgi:alkylation response protein AidB-like acyl-CoA dehydrogenase